MKRLILLVAMCLMVGVVSAQYGNYTTFTYNITAGAGAQTNYQMKFILSNASGISGYYSGDNVIFTNGTTRADWYDINATDGSGSPVPFWVENNTQTAKNCTAWIKVPSIAIGNTSVGRWYYGDAAQSSSTMNGYTTFDRFDDWDGASLNTTQWTKTASATATQSGGLLSLSTSTASVQGINTSSYGTNYSIVSRLKADANSANYYQTVGFDGRFSAGTQYAFANANGANFMWSANSGSAGSGNIVGSDTNYHRFETIRNGTTSFITYVDSSTAVTTTYVPTGSLPMHLGLFSATGTAALTSDWIFVRKYAFREPTTSNYTLAGTVVVTPISASFIQSLNPSEVGQSVTFTDTSTGTPVTWNWTLAGTTLTNSTQNAAYTYPTAGTYTILLNVTNATGDWSNTSQTHNVTNASGFAPQDIWMEGEYLQTFHITDSATGLPIPVVDLQDTAMQTYTTTNGTGYLTEPFGASTVVFVSSGYNSKSVSYVFDSDESHDVQMTASTPGGSQSVWYTPWQVRFRIVDYYGKPLPGTNVTANYVASTLPSTDPNWLVGAFGVGEEVAADMLNSSMAMTGVTDDNGGLSFTMFKSIQYSFLITNTTSGVSSTKNIYPSDSEYVIYVRTAGQTANNNTLATRNATLPWYSVNSTHINLNMTYIDTSLCTSQLVFRVWFRDNGTEVHNTTWSGFGASTVYDNHTIAKAPIGMEYLWGYNATTVC